MAGPVGVHPGAWLVQKLVGVRSEIVSLSLEKIGRNDLKVIDLS